MTAVLKVDKSVSQLADCWVELWDGRMAGTRVHSTVDRSDVKKADYLVVCLVSQMVEMWVD